MRLDELRIGVQSSRPQVAHARAPAADRADERRGSIVAQSSRPTRADRPACRASSGIPRQSRILPWGIIRAHGHQPHRPARRPARAAPSPDDFRHCYSKDKAQLVRRLSRIEGQVRGIARMIEREEYCVDILQQTAALRAAVDALSIMVLEDHVQGCVRTAAERGEADAYVDEVIDVVRRTLGRPDPDGRRPA